MTAQETVTTAPQASDDEAGARPQDLPVFAARHSDLSASHLRHADAMVGLEKLMDGEL